MPENIYATKTIRLVSRITKLVLKGYQISQPIFAKKKKKIKTTKTFQLAPLSSNIQGDSEGVCSTLGNDSMCDSKQKSSYEHGSDFERLPRYGKKKIRTILRARTAIT